MADSDSLNLQLHSLAAKAEISQLSPVSVRLHPSKPKEWHFVIHGRENTPYEGGIYYGMVSFEASDTCKSAYLKLITPNGRFKENVPFLLNCGNKEPNLSCEDDVRRMLLGLEDVWYKNDKIHGRLQMPCKRRRLLAQESGRFNQTVEGFVQIFPDIVEHIRGLQQHDPMRTRQSYESDDDPGVVNLLMERTLKMAMQAIEKSSNHGKFSTHVFSDKPSHTIQSLEVNDPSIDVDSSRNSTITLESRLDSGNGSNSEKKSGVEHPSLASVRSKESNLSGSKSAKKTSSEPLTSPSCAPVPEGRDDPELFSLDPFKALAILHSECLKNSRKPRKSSSRITPEENPGPQKLQLVCELESENQSVQPRTTEDCSREVMTSEKSVPSEKKAATRCASEESSTENDYKDFAAIGLSDMLPMKGKLAELLQERTPEFPGNSCAGTTPVGVRLEELGCNRLFQPPTSSSPIEMQSQGNFLHKKLEVSNPDNVLDRNNKTLLRKFSLRELAGFPSNRIDPWQSKLSSKELRLSFSKQQNVSFKVNRYAKELDRLEDSSFYDFFSAKLERMRRELVPEEEEDRSFAPLVDENSNYEPDRHAAVSTGYTVNSSRLQKCEEQPVPSAMSGNYSENQKSPSLSQRFRLLSLLHNNSLQNQSLFLQERTNGNPGQPKAMLTPKEMANPVAVSRQVYGMQLPDVKARSLGQVSNLKHEVCSKMKYRRGPMRPIDIQKGSGHRHQVQNILQGNEKKPNLLPNNSLLCSRGQMESGSRKSGPSPNLHRVILNPDQLLNWRSVLKEPEVPRRKSDGTLPNFQNRKQDANLLRHQGQISHTSNEVCEGSRNMLPRLQYLWKPEPQLDYGPRFEHIVRSTCLNRGSITSRKR